MEESCATFDTCDNKNGTNSRRCKPFVSVVMFDTETTSSSKWKRITELCLLSVQTDELKSECFPRVINKLQLCFNPRTVISREASLITGLYNDVLEVMPAFSEAAQLMINFLNSLPKPLCLIAHYGNRFDFPLLLTELERVNCSLPAELEAEIWCCDSWSAFRVLDGLPPVPEWLLQKENKGKRLKEESPTKRTPVKQESAGFTGKKELAESSYSTALHTQSDPSLLSNKNENTGKEQFLESSNSTDPHSVPCSEGKTNRIEINPRTKECPVKRGAEGRGDAVCKLPKVDDSQCNFSKPEMLQSRGPNEGHFVEMAVTTSTQQSELERTPPKKTDSSSAAFTKQQFVKASNPVPVDCAGREKVTRKLFSGKPSVEADTADSWPQNISTNKSMCFSSQESITDNEILHIADQMEFEAGIAINTESVTTPQLQKQMLAQGLQSLEGGKTLTESTESNCSDTNKVTPGKEKPFPQLSPTLCPSATSVGSSDDNAGTGTVNSPTSSNSYKLTDIYKRQFGCYPLKAHTAEDDCHTLLKIITKRPVEFLKYMETEAVPFSSFRSCNE